MSARPRHPNPFLNTSLFSRLFHGWVSPLMIEARRQGSLQISDLYELPPHLESSTLIDELETYWNEEIQRDPDKPSFLRATIRTMRWRPLFFGLLLIPKELLNIAQPILLAFLMDFFEPCSTMSSVQAWLLALGTVLTALGSSILFNYSYYRIFIHALQMRVAYQGLVFRKMLRLSTRSLNTMSSGAITNIFSNDCSHIEMALVFFNQIWLSPLEMIIVVFLFWYFVNYVGLIAIGYTALLLIIQTVFGRFFLRIRNKIVKVTDERVKVMSEVIKSMRVIKMYCWESAFDKKVRGIRNREIIQYGLHFLLNSVRMLLYQTYTSVTFLMIYATMWYLNIHFDPHFYAIASYLLTYMRMTIIEFFSFAVKNLVQYLSAQQRIKKFLLLEETEKYKRISFKSKMNFVSINQDVSTTSRYIQTALPFIQCHLKTAQWEKDSVFSLKNVVFDAHPGDLICIVGPVGCGKSSLLQSLLGEIAFFEGIVQLDGSSCYVPQEAWIFPATIKKNILFGKEYDSHLFDRVLQATALDIDFNEFPSGANTIVGDQGLMLSGGQKARINMARALYRDADIYLLDDPLSAVDPRVAKHLFDKAIKDYLHDKICILVTHQVQFLENATKIIVLNQGEIVESGGFKDLTSISSSFTRLLNDVHQQELENSNVFDKQESIHESSNNRKKDLELSTISTNAEIKEKGTVKWRVYLEYLRAGAGIIFGLILLLFLLSIREGTYVFSTWWLATWNEDENDRHQILNNCTNYLKNNSIWNMTDQQWNDYRNNLFYVYSSAVGIVVLLTFFRNIILESIFINAARVLHNKMFQRIIRAPISFFESNPVGRILNRFTKDIFIMDSMMPEDVFNFLDCCFQVLGVVGLVGWINYWSFIPAFLCFLGLLFVRYRYAPSSRCLKRLEGTTRSPVYSHLASTLDGLKVIRSFTSENVSTSDFHLNLDDNTRVNHLIIETNRWAGFRFDWVALVFIALVTLLAMVLRVTNYLHISSIQLALIVSNSLTLMSLLQWTIRQSVVAETQMTSVERVLEYCSLDQEPPAEVEENCRPDIHWPGHGQIIFDRVSMKHSTELHSSSFGLRNISMTIHGGEKVGIVGRTGAGKSSLIQTLFRMGIIVEGQIIIDDIDITSIGLNDLRSRISIIPQDPVLFTGTIRDNLDQFHEYSDEQIWNSLEQVQLRTVLTDEMTNGLESLVNENGSNLSVGQKQLICLARAMMKKNKILVIDEATANVDNVTDELIQKTIRDNFRQCTVLTVAHRLRTIIDSDRILVLDHGRMIEFDEPQTLLSNPMSQFSFLVEQTGFVEAEYLRTLASQRASQT